MDRRVCLLFLGIAGALSVAGCGQASSQTSTPPGIQEPLVVYDLPVTRLVTDYEDFPGRTEAIYTVEVRARVSGYLKRVYFQDGQEVKKDDLLFTIDPRQFRATLDRAKATLEQAEAHSRRLNNEFRRAKILFEQGKSISREEYDRYAFDYAESEAGLSTAKANFELAQLDLDWTNVTADLPEGVTGRLGRRLVDPGNLIKSDDTLMTTIVSQDPIYVYFDVHEQAMLRLRRLLETGQLKARSDREVPVLIGLSDEKDKSTGNPIFPHQGTVDFTDNRVDQNTGTLRFRAKMSNPNHLITPGLFVKVRLPIGEPHKALLVREQSIQSDQGLKKVFVLRLKDDLGQPYVIEDPVTRKPALDKSGKPIAGYRPMTVDVGTPGVLRDRFREVGAGIKEGDLVVAQGMQKIRLGVNPVTKKPFLVQARAWTPDDDRDPLAPQGAGSPPPAAAPAASKAPATAALSAPTQATPKEARETPSPESGKISTH